ncbi:hypothetical protein ACI782_25530 [Geodermatophilus sp. SYSU D00703]
MLRAVEDFYEFASDVVTGLEHPRFPADVVLSSLRGHLDAHWAVLQRTTSTTGATEIVVSGIGDDVIPVMIGATQAMRDQHPLMTGHVRGDLAPTTAQEAAGGWIAWRRNPVSAFLADLGGGEQMVSVGLRGGPDEVCALAFTRPRRDFDEREVDLLRTVQPFLQAVDRHVARMDRWAGGWPRRSRGPPCGQRA